MHLKPPEDYGILNEQTQPEVASIAGRGLKTGELTPEEIRKVCAVALHHAQKCYKRGPSNRELIDAVALGLPDVSSGT